MSQTNYTLPTTAGRNWAAAAYAGQTVPAIDRMVFGDGVRQPTGGETALLNVVHTATLSASGVYPGQTAAFFDAYLDAALGPFIIREHGLLLSDGTLVAIGVRDPGIPKADPASGAADDFTYRIDVFFDHLDTLVVEVVPVHGLTAERRVDTTAPLTGGGDLSVNRTIGFDAIGDTTLATLIVGYVDRVDQQARQEVRSRIGRQWLAGLDDALASIDAGDTL